VSHSCVLVTAGAPAGKFLFLFSSCWTLHLLKLHWFSIYILFLLFFTIFVTFRNLLWIAVLSTSPRSLFSCHFVILFLFIYPLSCYFIDSVRFFSSAAPSLTSTEIVAAVRVALNEAKEEQKISELVFSDCSLGVVKAYLARIHIGFEQGQISELPTNSASFEAFHWNRNEEDDTPRAMAHLKAQLEKFGVPLHTGGYELYDVHKSKTILSLEDKKTGVLKGGTDLILGPSGLHLLGVVQQSCVAFELKTEAVATQHKLKSFLSQATLELIAANYYSNQTTVVVLTDLSTATTILSLSNVPNTEHLKVIVYEDLTLNQAAQFVADHVAKMCVPSADYRLGSDNFGVSREAVEVLQVFKRARVSPLEDSVVWEHFQDMLHDSAPGTRERADAINELYRACDFPQPSWLSMYT
jgi:hypothetical protein